MARSDELASFVDALEHQPPPLARIVAIEQRPLTAPLTAGSFTILESTAGTGATTAIPPDIAICDHCRRELLDPADRRYHYPFINCTNCGPRFTIVETIPYDRPKTSMKVFTMCPDCHREYCDPGKPALSCPAQRLPGLRPAPVLAWARRGDDRVRRPDPGRGDRAAAGKNRRPARPRRFSSRRRRHLAVGGGDPAATQGPAGQTAGRDAARHRHCRRRFSDQ